MAEQRWTVGYSDGSGPEYIVAGETPIAVVLWGCGCCKPDRALTPEETARAHMLAAAPRMLSALKDAEKILAQLREAGQPVQVELYDTRAAIAQAEQGR